MPKSEKTLKMRHWK